VLGLHSKVSVNDLRALAERRGLNKFATVPKVALMCGLAEADAKLFEGETAGIRTSSRLQQGSWSFS